MTSQHLNFFLFRIMTGDPVQVIVPPRIPKEAKDEIAKSFGLDRPVWLNLAFIAGLPTG